MRRRPVCAPLILSRMDLAARLRRTSDDFLGRLDELESLENEKRKLEPGSAAFLALAERITAVSRELFHASQVQAALGEQTADLQATASADAPVASIDETPPRELEAILADWRQVERQLAEASPDSDAAARLRVEADRLRIEYRAAFQVRPDDPRNR